MSEAPNLATSWATPVVKFQMTKISFQQVMSGGGGAR